MLDDGRGGVHGHSESSGMSGRSRLECDEMLDGGGGGARRCSGPEAAQRSTGLLARGCLVRRDRGCAVGGDQIFQVRYREHNSAAEPNRRELAGCSEPSHGSRADAERRGGVVERNGEALARSDRAHDAPIIIAMAAD